MYAIYSTGTTCSYSLNITSKLSCSDLWRSYYSAHFSGRTYMGVFAHTAIRASMRAWRTLNVQSNDCPSSELIIIDFNPHFTSERKWCICQMQLFVAVDQRLAFWDSSNLAF